MRTGQYKGHKADWRTPLILNANYEPLRTDQWTAGIRYYSYAGLNYNLQAFNVVDQFGEIYVKYRLDRLTINASTASIIPGWEVSPTPCSTALVCVSPSPKPPI